MLLSKISNVSFKRSIISNPNRKIVNNSNPRKQFSWQGYMKANRDVFERSLSKTPSELERSFDDFASEENTPVDNEIKVSSPEARDFLIMHDIERRAKEKYSKKIQEYIQTVHDPAFLEKDSSIESIFLNSATFDEDESSNPIFIAGLRNEKGKDFPTIRYYYSTDLDGKFKEDTLDPNPKF